jgi:hypothetical protein
VRALISPHHDASQQTLVVRTRSYPCVTALLLFKRELGWACLPRGTFLKARIRMRIFFCGIQTAVSTKEGVMCALAR